MFGQGPIRRPKVAGQVVPSPAPSPALFTAARTDLSRGLLLDDAPGTYTPDPDRQRRVLAKAEAKGRPAGGLRAPKPAGFRPDLEGLRGLAVVLVVLFHAGVPYLDGGYVGVDVFYVLSGFFITGLLIKELEHSGRVSLPQFYARRGRRLLPAATLVLVVTAVASYLLLPPLRLAELGWDTITATWNVANFRFAEQASDYFAFGQAQSPLLHYWSLAVEEQFYLVWPLLIWGAARLARGRLRVTVAVVLAVVVLASFAWSVWLTPVNQAAAFYLLPTRAWELAAGGLVALVAVKIFPVLARSGWAALAGWAAVGALGWAVVTYEAGMLFPGSAAAAPVLATVVLILVGGARFGPGMLLRAGPARALGRWSYSLYLWHWPFLLLPATWLGRPLSGEETAVVVAAAVVVSAATYVWWENPWRTSQFLGRSLRASFTFILVCVLAGTAAGAGLLVAAKAERAGPAVMNTAVQILSAPSVLGVVAEAADAQNPVPGNLTPELSIARQNQSAAYADRCFAEVSDPTVLGECVYGDPEGQVEVWLVGDSHAAQWFTVMDAIAKDRGWRLTVHARVLCSLVDGELENPLAKGEPYRECTWWQESLLAKLADQRPDLVVASSTSVLISTREEEFYNRVGQIAALAGQVLILGDTPRQSSDVPVCVSAHPESVSACQTLRVDAEPVAGLGVMSRTADRLGLPYQPTVPWLCTETTCPVIVGNVLMYRDPTHLTSAGSLLLRPLLEEALVGALASAPASVPAP
jgi:peptidoglycan/LPS O-acetylase OafA/YrhL